MSATPVTERTDIRRQGLHGRRRDFCRLWIPFPAPDQATSSRYFRVCEHAVPCAETPPVPRPASAVRRGLRACHARNRFRLQPDRSSRHPVANRAHASESTALPLSNVPLHLRNGRARSGANAPSAAGSTGQSAGIRPKARSPLRYRQCRLPTTPAHRTGTVSFPTSGPAYAASARRAARRLPRRRDARHRQAAFSCRGARHARPPTGP